MTDFDLELDGVTSLQAEIDDLKDDFGSDPVYVVGASASYAVHIEFGRGPIEAPEGSAIPIETDSGETIFRKSVSGHPPYPFFRPAIREFKANPQTFLLENSNLSSINDIQSTEQLVESVAFALENQMKTNATAQSSGRSPGTDSDHPAVVTGNLRSSISAVRIN